MTTAENIAALLEDDCTFFTETGTHITTICDRQAWRVMECDEAGWFLYCFGDGSVIITTPEVWGVVSRRDSDGAWVTDGGETVIGTPDGDRLAGWRWAA